MQDINHFSIMFYNIISTTYQKIGDLFCPVHISGLSHSVTLILEILHRFECTLFFKIVFIRLQITFFSNRN
jgi:hypothetical protein